MTAPIASRWTGEAFEPLPRFRGSCDATFAVGELYSLEIVEQAQGKQDRFYHASMRDAWANLPEDLAERYPTADDFRRHCLAKCGFATVSRMAMKTTNDAVLALAMMAKLGLMAHLDGAVLVIVEPRSQKMRGPNAMSKEDRLASYTATLDYAASLIGATADQVRRNAAQVA